MVEKMPQEKKNRAIPVIALRSASTGASLHMAAYLLYLSGRRFGLDARLLPSASILYLYLFFFHQNPQQIDFGVVLFKIKSPPLMQRVKFSQVIAGPNDTRHRFTLTNE